MYYSWTEEENIFAQDMIDGKTSIVAPLQPEASVSIDPNSITKELCDRVCGEENTRRYWNPSIPDAALYILGNGGNNWNTIYQELEDGGWKGRSVSLLKEIVKHFRSQELPPAIDEISTEPPTLGNPSLLRNNEADGKIGVLSDKSGEGVSLTIRFPYDDHLVFVVKRIPGREWNPTKKRWEVPIERSADVFRNFEHFELSEKAQKLKDSL